MRISDWSSDVCSSDLRKEYQLVTGFLCNDIGTPLQSQCTNTNLPKKVSLSVLGSVTSSSTSTSPPRVSILTTDCCQEEIGRASCREKCVSTCRSRWSPYH